MNILLQIMDGAKLTDNNGIVSDFKNVILIMTSNLGTKEANVMGFNKDDSAKSYKAVKNFFSPEFRNRLSRVIEFKKLGVEELQSIVKIELNKLNTQLSPKNITITATKTAIKELALKANPEFGARDITKVIDRRW